MKETAILTACRVTLAHEFGDASISWEGMSAALETGPGARLLARSEQFPETAEARDIYPVLKLTERNGRSYWVSVVLTFRWQLGQLFLENVSILLFVAVGLAGIRQIVLRAEWDRDSKEPVGPHAQPHWHVYGSRLTPFETHHYFLFDEAGGLSELGSDMVDSTGTEDPNDDLRRFHLAMCARWQLEGAELHYEVPDDAKVEQWLGNCVRYIKGQVEYVADQLPRPGLGQLPPF